MKWILKAVIQKVISWLPASQKVNYLFQKYVTRGVRLSGQYFGDKLGHTADHLRFYNKYGKVENFMALELGSGWYPVIPIGLFLGGANSVISIDISPLMTAEGIRETIAKYLEWYASGKLDHIKPYIKEERLQVLENLETANLSKEVLLESLNLELQIRDARNTGFEESSFDLVCSNNTYEHIYGGILKDIIKEFQRIVKPGGINSHFIDMSDHFAHLDNSITIYNYLKYTEKQWSRIDNSVQPQNRLRLPDYRKMYAEAGISVLEEERRPGSISHLKKVTVAAPFSGYTQEEIAVSHVHLVSSK